MVCHFLTYIYFNVILKSFREGCLFLIYRVARHGGRYATVVTVQNNTLGLGSAMGKWNCYAVTVTQGISNTNDRFGVNGTVAL